MYHKITDIISAELWDKKRVRRVVGYELWLICDDTERAFRIRRVIFPDWYTDEEIFDAIALAENTVDYLNEQLVNDYE